MDKPIFSLIASAVRNHRYQEFYDCFARDQVPLRIEDAARSGHQQNFKSVLQQYAQQSLDWPPQYLLLDEKGPDHAKCFEVCVGVGARRFSSCWGASKKQAEQQAALQALVELGVATVDDGGDVTVLDELQEQPADAQEEGTEAGLK